MQTDRSLRLVVGENQQTPYSISRKHCANMSCDSISAKPAAQGFISAVPEVGRDSGEHSFTASSAGKSLGKGADIL